MRTLSFLLRKEFLQVTRDRAMLRLLIAMPILQLLVLGSAATFQIRQTPVYLIDNDRTSASRGLVERLVASGHFEIAAASRSPAHADRAMLEREVSAIVHLPSGFERDLIRRGAAPVQHAILRGDELPGASVFQLEEGLDTGPVYGTVTEPIGPHDTAGDLLDRLARTGAHLLVRVLDGIAQGTARAVPQPADGVSLAPKITVADARVRWSEPALAVDRRVRACTPAPGAWTTFRGARVKLGPVQVTEEPPLAPGEIRLDQRRVLVGTATTPVALGQVQPAGRKQMAAEDWMRGVRPAAGERFG